MVGRMAIVQVSSRLAQTAVLGLGVLAGCRAPAAPAASAPIRTVTATALADEEGEPPVIVDVRERAQFDAGHIADARWLDPASLRATVDGVEGQVAPRGAAEAIFGEAGLAPDDAVVVTAEGNGTDPARVAWTLRYYGHEGPVALLDGGMAAWVADGQPVDTEAPVRGTTGYLGRATRDLLRVDKAWMLAHLDDEDVAIYDVRTPEEYAGGHIPGAVNVNWTENVDLDGQFQTADEVRRLHEEPTAPTLVVYCRTGSRAAVSWALLRAAGYEDVRLYDGSWAEWGADPQTPKEP